MIKTKILWWIPEHRETVEDAAVYEVSAVYDLAEVAELIAERYFYEHDGWESEWPITFMLQLAGENHEFSIDQETSPNFIATERL